MSNLEKEVLQELNQTGIGPGGLGGTYAGNPIACAAALAVLQIFEQENLLEKANQLGDTLRQGLLAIAEDHPEIGDVRGLGR